MATRPQLFSGARGLLAVDGRVLGFVTDVSVNIQANVRPVHTFGAPNARSVEPLSTGASLSIGRVFPMNKPDGSVVNTSDIVLGIEPIINLMLASEDISISLTDKITGRVVADVKNCRFAGRSLNLSASQIAQERIQLVGIYDAAGGNTPDAIGLA
jgi:hypothetical protein